MKVKEIFGNLRLERMRENSRQYNFEIKYIEVKNLVEADTLGRINEESPEITKLEKRSKN